MEKFYRESYLSNGVRVLSETMPAVRSVTLGIWFRVGSRDETPDEAGMSHFMEHMLFKGTPTRSAADISVEFDCMGAELNAFTSREYTCFYSRFVDERLEQATEALSDMVINSTFPPEEVESERKVVIEEIARSEDSPDDHVFDVFSDELFPTAPMGRPILGTRESVGGFDHDDLVAYHDKRYVAENCTVVAAGNVDHERLVEACERFLGTMRQGAATVRDAAPERARRYFAAEKKDTEQAHLVIGMEGLKCTDGDRYAAATMDIIFGGGMSSRLFQEVREKRGLVYTIFSNMSSYHETGAFSIYAGTRLENLAEVLEVVFAEMRKMLDEGITANELERARSYVVGQSIMAMEATRTRMSRMGRSAATGTPLHSLDETIECYERVTIDDVNRVAQRIFSQRPAIAVVSAAEVDEVEKLVKDSIGL